MSNFLKIIKLLSLLFIIIPAIAELMLGLMRDVHNKVNKHV